MDRTSDVQLPAIVLAHTNPNSILPPPAAANASGAGAIVASSASAFSASASSLSSASPAALSFAARADRWVQSYRALLDAWKMWHARARFDTARAALVAQWVMAGVSAASSSSSSSSSGLSSASASSGSALSAAATALRAQLAPVAPQVYLAPRMRVMDLTGQWQKILFSTWPQILFGSA